MLELTGKCCGGIEAIEFMESLADIIDVNIRTGKFREKYGEALNRFRYEVAKGIGKQKKVTKAKKGYHDTMLCGNCGFNADYPEYKFCPNCGTRYIV